MENPKFVSSYGPLTPVALENSGLLARYYGYATGGNDNWTLNGFWIGQWQCPSHQGSCFAIGIGGHRSIVSQVYAKFKKLSVASYYPRLDVPYKVGVSQTNIGDLLMVFKLSNQGYVN